MKTEPMTESATATVTGPGRQSPVLPPQPAQPAPQRSQADYVWPLPDGVRVELRFAGGPFTRDGLRLLREYLNVVEKTMPSDASREPVASPSEPERPA